MDRTPRAVSPASYDAKTMPGGPWRAYRPRAYDQVYALRIAWPFDYTGSDGKKTATINEGWIVVHSDGTSEALDAATFAARYELDE